MQQSSSYVGFQHPNDTAGGAGGDGVTHELERDRGKRAKRVTLGPVSKGAITARGRVKPWETRENGAPNRPRKVARENTAAGGSCTGGQGEDTTRASRQGGETHMGGALGGG